MRYKASTHPLFSRNNRYKRYGLIIEDFVWVDLRQIRFPLQPLCEMDPKRHKSRDLPRVVIKLLTDKNGHMDLSVDNFPHIDVLKLYEKYNEALWTSDLYKKTRYYQFHRGFREENINPDVRTDEWIHSKVVRFVKLYDDIRRTGYFYEFNGNKSYISILDKPILELRYGIKTDIPGYELWDGGHRLVILHYLGYTKVKALKLSIG
jgi:hypothetical protein